MKKPKVDLNGIMTSGLDAYIEEAGRKFAERIDFEVMCSALEQSGWHRVAVPCKDTLQADEIWNWVYNNQNIKQGSHGLEGDWIFESVTDANWFMMRWLSK